MISNLAEAHAKIATFFESKFISNLKIAVQRLKDFCGRDNCLSKFFKDTRQKFLLQGHKFGKISQ